jgi:hypothetical protein
MRNSLIFRYTERNRGFESRQPDHYLNHYFLKGNDPLKMLSAGVTGGGMRTQP